MTQRDLISLLFFGINIARLENGTSNGQKEHYNLTAVYLCRLFQDEQLQ